MSVALSAPPAPAPVLPIDLEGVGVDLDGRTVLDGIDLRLREARIGVIGANGSGKSTLARLLNALQLPSRGRVKVDRSDTRSDARAIRRRVGFVFQNPDNQIVYPTVAEDLAFGLKNIGCGREESERRVARALSRHGMADFGPRAVHQLSGGEKQLIALMGVTLMEPDCIVLDEPTTALDLRHRRRFMAALESMDCTVIMVTHDLDALRSFDRVILLEDGAVRADGSPAASIAAYVRSCT
ncbi:energy-coupling factor ABC transporter ATP-binding protein [Minwuia thermotolerans]|uniref:Cobalt ABC transporter ATP-binding protein n=1 Tax=Minwuia thermotolerans TaxID=2056226 RepID=A0A2M9G5V3_9PROT|nr:ATP-binding cassette domain-containing protein [Minwuia thermotolerans]PJK31093.1 cobalt ABC transporter ATP-binding protein [Minwuia thermotolerans]